MALHFDNSYARLPERFYAKQTAAPVAAPQLEVFNDALGAQLGFEPAQQPVTDWLSGNAVPEGADPLAQAYAGHQFAHFNPQLGDGRALLLGEVLDRDGARWDVQLKGSGRTPYSRSGDGRAWLGPVIREYLMSEAMAVLGVPTTRALAIVSTGERVQRETALPGAILTRVARSHIRVGTFQFFAARSDVEALEALCAHTIARHFPEAEGPAGLLRAAVAAQADLIARWMGLGFVHGVMNTDNAHVGGITIDYGPCAYIDKYHPQAVYSSIDHQGRYAYSAQAQIAAWNMAQLATSLLPLMPDREAAIELFTEIVNGFAPRYQTAWRAEFGRKLGLDEVSDADVDLISDLLVLMAKDGADFTNSFRALSTGARDQFTDRDAFDAWEARWLARLDRPRAQLDKVNPAVIARTHRIEEAINAAVGADWGPFHRLHSALARPFKTPDEDLMRPPLDDEIVRQTFCGT